MSGRGREFKAVIRWPWVGQKRSEGREGKGEVTVREEREGERFLVRSMTAFPFSKATMKAFLEDLIKMCDLQRSVLEFDISSRSQESSNRTPSSRVDPLSFPPLKTREKTT